MDWLRPKLNQNELKFFVDEVEKEQYAVDGSGMQHTYCILSTAVQSSLDGIQPIVFIAGALAKSNCAIVKQFIKYVTRLGEKGWESFYVQASRW